MESPSAFRGRFGNRQILWQVFYSGYCLGLDEYAPIGIVMALDDGLESEAITQRTGIRFYSLERSAGFRQKFAEDLLEGIIPQWERELEAQLGEHPSQRWIAVSPHTAGALREFTNRLGIGCIDVDGGIYEHLSGKAALQQAMAQISLPIPLGRWMSLARAGYKELANEFGSRFVMQLEYGAAGSGTAFVNSEEEFAAATQKLGDKNIWATPYAGDLSFNVSGLATGSGTVVAYPSVQIVGQPALMSAPGVHCGNDFTASASAPHGLLNSIREQTTAIGQWLAAQGYRGMFGLDFVVCETTGQAYAVDLNPRWQGSTSLQAQASARRGHVPMAAAEMAYRTGVLEEAELLRMGDSFFEPVEGSQCFLRAPSTGDWSAGNEMAAGVYTSRLGWKRPGLRLGDLESTEEVLLNGHNPRRGRQIAAGERIFRVCSLKRMVDPASGRLAGWASEAARLLEAAVELRLLSGGPG